MYGRCETDPFDQATDVCDSCYGEFCSACMVKTKGRKHPICKECTIIASGVRPGAKPLLRGSKKTAAKRRKALQQAPEVSRAFEYFDDAGSKPEPAVTDDGIAAEAPEEATGTDEVDAPTEASGSAPTTDSDEAPPPPLDGQLPDPVAIPDPTPTPTASARSVTPGLAALAKHAAERKSEPHEDLTAVPAPDWLTAPVDGANPFADEAPIETEPPIEADAGRDTSTSPPTSNPQREGRTPIDASAKPVTEGFDWVTEMPARGSSTPLPARGRGQGTDPAGEPAAGAVATAEKPAALPRRRSTLRTPDDDRR